MGGRHEEHSGDAMAALFHHAIHSTIPLKLN
ncbi:hypothetical protein CO2235_10417 [Cupriavidus oxalaticus]|uniref:Uncharacterized protein n=1 Tax=Cupriavidus oxalaticus TaxID=96344 RepID=A0A976G8B1_9BURK|nr:hypothetical protein CO2235_10417 [Cupriavidus oxalaticus]